MEEKRLYEDDSAVMGAVHERFVELERLLSRLHDGVAERAEVARIEQLLDGDPEACEFYIDYTHLVADIEREVSTPQAVGVGSKTVPLAVAQSTALFFEGQSTKQILSPSWRPLPWFAAAAAVIVFAGFLALFFGKKGALLPTTTDAIAETVPAEMHDEGVAILMEEVGGVFGNAGLRPDLTDGVLKQGALRLESGIAEIQFYSGARILLEAPAILELSSENSALLLDGRLRAQIPSQALGFTITTPQLEIVDLGAQGEADCEFGVNVDREGERTEVHCFDGKLELLKVSARPSPTGLFELTSGKALAYPTNGPVDRSKPNADEKTFISFEQLLEKRLARAKQRHVGWGEYMEKLQADPSILALYSFEDQKAKDRTLVNQAFYRDQFSHGAIVGCRWTNGRWPSKGALEFNRRSDRVTVQAAGKQDAVTFTAWVRLGALPQRGCSILSSTEMHDGAVEWSISNNKLSLTVARAGQVVRYDSGVVFDPMMTPGQWMHLACVYDTQSATTVSHYIDAERVWQGEMPATAILPIEIKGAQIGNFGGKNPDGKRPVRHLTGRIDEIAIFGRVLDDAEIAEMADVGGVQ